MLLPSEVVDRIKGLLGNVPEGESASILVDTSGHGQWVIKLTRFDRFTVSTASYSEMGPPLDNNIAVRENNRRAFPQQVRQAPAARI